MNRELSSSPHHNIDETKIKAPTRGAVGGDIMAWWVLTIPPHIMTEEEEREFFGGMSGEEYKKYCEEHQHEWIGFISGQGEPGQRRAAPENSTEETFL